MTMLQEVERPVPDRAGPRGSWVEAHPLISFVGLAYAISWSLWLVALLLGGDESVWGGVAFVAGAFGPAAAALIVLRASGGSVRTWAMAIVHWRAPARYWLYALALPAALYGLANLILLVMGEPVEWTLIGDRLVPYLGTFVVTMFLLGGQEEPGWRGFALPRLQERFSPVKATLVLGLIWGVWHLPLGPLYMIVPFVLAFFYTWLYNRTGSVLLAIVLHASFTPAQDHLNLLPEVEHGAADLAVGLAYILGVGAVVLLTMGRLGFNAADNKRRIG